MHFLVIITQKKVDYPHTILHLFCSKKKKIKIMITYGSFLFEAPTESLVARTNIVSCEVNKTVGDVGHVTGLLTRAHPTRKN